MRKRRYQDTVRSILSCFKWVVGSWHNNQTKIPENLTLREGKENAFYKKISSALFVPVLVETLILVNFTSCPSQCRAVGGSKMDHRTFNLQHLLKQSTSDLGTKLSSWWLLSSPGWDWLLSSVQKKNKTILKKTLSWTNLSLQISFPSFSLIKGSLLVADSGEWTGAQFLHFNQRTKKLPNHLTKKKAKTNSKKNWLRHYTNQSFCRMQINARSKPRKSTNSFQSWISTT